MTKSDGLGNRGTATTHVRRDAPANNSTDSANGANGANGASDGKRVSGVNASSVATVDADAFDPRAGVAGDLPAATGVHTTTQVAALRSSSKKTAKTAAGRASRLGVALAKVRKVVTGVAAASLIGLAVLPLTFHDTQAQTVYVNVNGAGTSSPEYQGAAQAAREHKEPFIAVRPQQLEAVLADVESGKTTLRKLVPSGHSSGLWFAGQDAQGSNHIGIDDMAALAKKYPKAFGEVKLFFAMACNAGTEENSRVWMDMFPHANALVGFDHIGPASDRPAAGAVLVNVDRELSKVDFGKLTRDDAMKLGQRLSALPGASETEFAVRLRTSDGNTVFFSKLNAPTTASASQDLVDQLRPTAFTAYVDGAQPPDGHDTANPVRVFYNASQDLLNALGRDITARGGDPSIDPAYQRALHEKEAALKLIYFPVVLENVEFHLRTDMNAAGKELAAHGIKLEIGDVGKMTRPQIMDLAKTLRELPAYNLADFVQRNAADIAIVDAAQMRSAGMSAQSLTTLNDKMSDARLDSFRAQLETLSAGGDDAMKGAATRLLAQLAAPRSPIVQEVRHVIDDGLAQLQDGVFSPDWITTERRG